MKKKNLDLTLFNNNINDKSKHIFINNKNIDWGEVKYFPSYLKEWKNVIYSYDKNKTKNITATTVNINKLISIFFDLHFRKNKFLKSAYITKKKFRTFLKRILISKTRIKYTNSKAIITLYTVNINKITLFKRYLKFSFLYLLKTKRNKDTKRNLKRLAIFKYLNNEIKIKYFDWKQNNKSKQIYNVNKSMLFKEFFKLKLNFVHKNLLSYNLYTKVYLSKVINYLYSKYLIMIRKYQFAYYINKYKFNNFYLLSKLNEELSKILDKKIEFNIINLKSIAYNTDIYTKALTLKLRKKRLSVSRAMWTIMHKGKIIKENLVTERGYTLKRVNRNLLENKYKNYSLVSLINNNSTLHKTLKNLYFLRKLSNLNLNYENNLQEKINKNFSNSMPIKLYYKDYDNILKKYTTNNNHIIQQNKKVYNVIFNSIKYKNMAGMKLTVSGRLTKRYRADRAVYKFYWKGGLKNTDSSFKKLSSVMFRGYLNSNLDYSIHKSKRRIGAFAVKGWISGK